MKYAWLYLIYVVSSVGIFVSVPGLALGAERTPSLTAQYSSIAPPVTGDVTDLKSPSWMSASILDSWSNLTTRQTDKSTTARLIFGPTALYCAFLVEQNPATITDQQRGNNVGFGLDDYVGLLLDTSGNGTNVYEFAANPHGIRFQTATQSIRYDPSWLAKTSRNPGGWFAELVIPYSILKFPQTKKPIWLINAVRYTAANQYNYTWTYSPNMISSTDPTFWPKLADIPVVAGGRPPSNAEVYGLASVGRDRNLFEAQSNEIVDERARNIGIDFKTPLTSGIDFVGTLNPDFSNVEVDQQTTAPQEFRRELAEYRPFFTEGAGYLPGDSVFYSPSIGLFTRGEKIEGQYGEIGVGVLNDGGDGRSDTAYNFAYSSLDQTLTAALAGAQVDVNKMSDLVNQVSASYTNLHSRLTFQTSFGVNSNSGGTTGERLNLSAGINKSNYQISAAYFSVGPNYAPTDAYVAQNDIAGPVLSLAANTTPSTRSFIRQASIYAFGDRYLDKSGAVRESDLETSCAIIFSNLLALTFSSSNSSLRSYVEPFPFYMGGVTTAYNQPSVELQYPLGTSSQSSFSYSSGPFNSTFLRQYAFSTQRSISKSLSAAFDYEFNLEIASSGELSQTLRRLSLVKTFDPDESISIGYREVSGTGGFSLPGSNFSASYRHRFGLGSNLYAEFGSPASAVTLNRFVVKYVQLIGSGAGE